MKKTHIFLSKTFWLATALHCLALSALFAQNERGQPFLRNFSPNEYKAHVQNWSVVQDARGFMYFGNGDGVMVYDGAVFRVIPLKHKSTPRSLVKGPGGVVYVGGVQEFGLVTPDGKGNLIYENLSDALGLPNFKDVWGADEAGGKIYFRTYEEVFEYDPATGKAKTFIKPPQAPAASRLQSSFSFKGKYYARLIGMGIVSPDGDSLRLAPEAEAMRKKPFLHVYENDGKKALVAASDSLYLFDPAAATFTALPENPANAMIRERRVYTGAQKGGMFAMGFSDKGAAVMDATGKVSLSISKELTGLQNDNIYTMEFDSQGGLWTGMNKGIARAEVNSPISYWNDKSGLLGTPEAIIRHKGVLYVATHSGLFWLEGEKAGQIPGETGQSWTLINFVLPGGGDTVLLAGTSTGVRVIKDKTIEKTLIGADGSAAFELRQSAKNPARLWIGLGKGFSSMLYENGLWRDEGKLEGYTDNTRAVVETPEGDLWLGTFRDGAVKVKVNDKDPAKSAFSYYKTDKGLPSLKNTLVFGMADKTVFGTEFGLYRFDGTTDKFVQETSISQNLSDGKRDVFTLIEDNTNGYVWVSGLFNEKGRISAFKKDKSGYNEIDGPFRRIPNMMVLAFYIDQAANTAWIGGSEGLFKFDMNKLAANPQPFNAYIRQVNAGDSVFFGGDYFTENQDKSLGVKYLLGQTQTEALLPSISYSLNSMLFTFSAPFYDGSGNVYSHQLDGFEDKWSEWSPQFTKEYTNLSKGVYTFRVKAKNIYGQESTEALYSFKVLPPWYLTYWAYFFYMVSAISVIYAAVRLNAKRLEKENQRLEQIIEKRTWEIQQKNSELEQQKEEILAQSDNLKQANKEIKEQQDNLLLKNVALEQQKEEIMSQAENLRELNTEISAQKNEIEAQKDEVERSFNNITILSEIGQKITSSLSLESIITTIYESVNALMDASAFGVGIYQEKQQQIMFKGFMEKGERLPDSADPMDATKHLSALCIKRKAPFIINNLAEEIQNYLQVENYEAKVGETPLSIIYYPLTFEGKVIGVITVQSFDADVYTTRHLTMLTTLAVYASIAIANADAFGQIQEKNQKITDSIRYAETIQHAILPSEEELKAAFRNHYVLFQPKDIVSGDFYWFSHIEKENKILVAAIDCTGHGVPGAFMSMIGNTILDEIVNMNDVHDPAKILVHLNEEIQTALRQREKANDDGMDMSLCLVEPQEGGGAEITFCGAKRSIFYLEPGNPMLQTVKGDNKSIGGMQKEKKAFTNKTFHLDKGGKVFMATDGITDQNGPDMRKFGVMNFMALLEKTAALSVSEQGIAVKQALDAHQKDADQRDDITFIAFEV